MSGPLVTFAAKEARETVKTWRLWVLPGILLFLALSSPVLTKLTPEIIRATTNSQSGIIVHIPPPTARDSYLQFMGNLAQLVTLAVIIAGAATISAERRAGTAVLVLTKPISRAAFVVLKATSQLAVLVVATVVGAALCIVTTVVLFGSASIGPFIETTALWLVFATMVLMLMVLLSAAMRGQAPAIGAGIALWIGLLVFTGFPLIRDHSPAGLMAASDAALKGRDVALLWPLATTVLAAAALLAAAAWAFGRREL
ncbi:MAG TPA: ABC transporter permease subunit [Thermoleophilia bacterium]|nr:ABC transporter permease subunit [Thermoleophilia bacterium]